MNKRLKNIKSTSLIELMISIMVIAVMVLSFYSLETYGHIQLTNADRKAKVHNALAYALEHMTKYIEMAVGDINNPAIQYFPWPSPNPNAFQVRVDFNGTPSDLTDDSMVRYRLTSNKLSVSCVTGGLGSCPASFDEDLTEKIVTGFVDSSLLPDPLPANPSGFYSLINATGSSIEIGLVGRYYPAQVATLATRLTNPQVAMKTKVSCNSCSTN